jgi:hypothetical protein
MEIIRPEDSVVVLEDKGMQGMHVAHRKSDEVNLAAGTAQEEKKDDETVPF